MFWYTITLVCCFLLFDICKISWAKYNILFNKKITDFCFIVYIFTIISFCIANSTAYYNTKNIFSIITISLFSIFISNKIFDFLLLKLFFKLYLLRLTNRLKNICINMQKENLISKINDLDLFIKSMNESNHEEKVEAINRIKNIQEQIKQLIL